MAKFWSKDIRMYLGGYDISQSQVRLTVTMRAQALEPTSFPDAAERVLPGIRQDGLEWAGIFDDNATGATADMYAAATAILGTATAGTLVTVLVGTGTGSVAYVGTALLNAKHVGSSFNDLVRIGADFGMDGSWTVATSLGVASSYTNEAGPAGSIDLGTASGTLTAYAHFLSRSANPTLTFNIIILGGTAGATLGTTLLAITSTARNATIGSVSIASGTANQFVIFKLSGLVPDSAVVQVNVKKAP